MLSLLRKKTTAAQLKNHIQKLTAGMYSCWMDSEG